MGTLQFRKTLSEHLRPDQEIHKKIYELSHRVLLRCVILAVSISIRREVNIGSRDIGDIGCCIVRLAAPIHRISFTPRGFLVAISVGAAAPAGRTLGALVAWSFLGRHEDSIADYARKQLHRTVATLSRKC